MEVRVIVKPERFRRGWLCFDLIFHDGFIKSYEFDNYEVMSHRMSERDFIHNTALEYYEALMGYRPEVSLIFY